MMEIPQDSRLLVPSRVPASNIAEPMSFSFSLHIYFNLNYTFIFRIEFYHHLRVRYSLNLIIIGRGSLILAFEEEFIDQVCGWSDIGRTTKGHLPYLESSHNLI